MTATTTVPTSSTLIRNLDEGAFRARFRCDRLTATVLASRFGYIVEHMCSQLLTTAFSPILRDFYDFAATVTGPPRADYPTPAVSNSIILFTARWPIRCGTRSRSTAPSGSSRAT